MLNEISKNYYCSAGCYGQTGVCLFNNCGYQCDSLRGICGAFHRKYPTPEQYKHEYGEEYPDDAAVYCKQIWPLKNRESSWHTFNFGWFKENRQKYLDDGEDLLIVCACTPFGKPEDDGRLE